MYLRNTTSRAITLLAKNPSLFGRMMIAKANSMRPVPRQPALRRIGNVVFEFEFGNSGSTAAMYFGACSLLVVNAMRRYLHRGDAFMDVGANIGYLSAIGADLVGSEGQVHSFEPVPRYFQRLLRLAELNPDYKIVPSACAAGDAPTSSTIYVTRKPGQSTLVAGYKNGAEVVSAAEIPVIRLDSYIESHHVERVGVIKIDAEGFELRVLEGLQGCLERTAVLPAIICEIAPRAYPLMGRRLSDLSDLMSQYGYAAVDIIDGKSPVDLTALTHVTDVLFLAES